MLSQSRSKHEEEPEEWKETLLASEAKSAQRADGSRTEEWQGIATQGTEVFSFSCICSWVGAALCTKGLAELV